MMAVYTFIHLEISKRRYILRFVTFMAMYVYI
jgi:hypothetical protein